MLDREAFGPGAVRFFSPILDAESPRRIFLVTGRASFAASGAKEKLDVFLRQREVVHFTGFSRVPTIADAQRGVRLLERAPCDLIVAVGGGTVLDMAKLVSLLSSQKEPPDAVARGEVDLQSPRLAMLAIPTTAGSGSEATSFAVAYLGDVKTSLEHPDLRPAYVILDPELTYSVSPRQTAVSGFDALAQGIESYWAVGSTEESRLYAAEAIRLVLPALEDAVRHPTPRTREQMLKGANQSGKAINISKTTAPHAISYPLTKFFGIPHGHAVALTLWRFLLINGHPETHEVSDPRGPAHVDGTMARLWDLMGGENPEECAQAIWNLMHRVGLETDLRHLGVDRPEHLERILGHVNLARLANNPIRVSEGMVSSLLRAEDLPAGAVTFAGRPGSG